MLWITVIGMLFAVIAGLVVLLTITDTFVATDVPPSLIRTA